MRMLCILHEFIPKYFVPRTKIFETAGICYVKVNDASQNLTSNTAAVWLMVRIKMQNSRTHYRR